MATQDSITEKYFVRALEDSDWFKNLKRSGSCLKLQELLQTSPLLLKEMGDGDVTVLDMGVRHGFVNLVEDVLNMFNSGGQCTHEGIDFTLEELLSKKNAEGLTVIGIAVMVGSFKIVRLLKRAIELCDKKGIVDRFVHHDVKICSSLDYVTWKSIKNARSRYPYVFPNDDGGNGQMNYGALSEGSTSPTGDDFLSPNSPTGAPMLSPIPSLSPGRDDAPLESDKFIVHEIIEKVWKDPIKYMEDIPQHHDVGKFGLPSFKDFREENRGFTGDPVKKCIRNWVKECKTHPEFEFVPAREVFVHFLCSVDSSWWPREVEIYNHVRSYFIAAVMRECRSREVLKALFKLHDPQGRTPLHVAIEHWNLDIVEMFWKLMKKSEEGPGCVSDEEAQECWNARDAAGRTPLHAVVISRFQSVEYLLRVKWVDVAARVQPQNYEEWVALLHWKAPYATLSKEYKEREHCTAMHLAVLHNHVHVVKQLIYDPLRSKKNYLNEYLKREPIPQNQGSGTLEGQCFSAIQLAASMGHVNILNLLLPERHVQDGGKWKSTKVLDDRDDTSSMPALHYSALFGQVEATRAILSSGLYDQFALTDRTKNTALHFAVTLHDTYARKRIQNHFLALQDFMPYDHVASSVIQEPLPSNFHDSPRNYTGNEKSCINLLLQAGIDVWTTNEDGEAPYPGSMANSEASQWWYEKVVSENINVKKSLSDAANATSVVAALVATASFIGPLQPPRGYDSTYGYIRINRLPIQIYLIGNCLSFFFSVASIITAVIPSLPMPKESMDDEVQRSQRSIRVASILLLISILCILASFSAASIAVIPFGWSERNVVGICILLGGGICLVVLTLYVLRLCRLVFHKNRYIRRMYNKYVRV